MNRNSAYALCRHTKTNGYLCQSPAMTTSAFCYHHQRIRRTRRTTITVAPVAPAPVPFNMPPLVSASAIQQAISAVLNAIGDGRLKPRQARIMLNMIRMASSNAGREL